MKKINCFLLLASLIVSIFVFGISCRKSSQTEIQTLVYTIAIPPTVAYTAKNLLVKLPIDSIYLYGSYTGQNGFDRAEWRKITGPACEIENPNKLTARVLKLQEGIYQFELTVFDKKNLQGKDTIAVTASEKSEFPTHAIIFKNLKWICPLGCSLEVKNIYLPQSVALKVFVQRGGSTKWEEAFPGFSGFKNYEYSIETRPGGAGMYNLIIFYSGLDDPTDFPNVAIAY